MEKVEFDDHEYECHHWIKEPLSSVLEGMMLFYFVDFEYIRFDFVYLVLYKQ